MAIKTISRPAFETLVSPGPDRQIPIYNWHAFKHSYSKKLVERLLKEFELKKGAWVMDPFCGGGTTLLSSKQSGMNSQGFDILPFSVFLSNVKIQDYDEKELLNDLLQLRTSVRSHKEIKAKLPSDIALLNKAFSRAVQTELLRIKTCINGIASTTNRNFFNLAFLSMLESVSNTAKTGGFLRLVSKDVPLNSIASMFLDRCAAMFADVLISSNGSLKPTRFADASLGDARELKTERLFNAVITSPPYPNRHDYTRIYALEMAFDFISGNDDLKRIRYETLRSHVEARKQYEADDYDEPKEIARLLKRMEENGTNNRQVPDMLKGYFEDMHLSLKQMKSKLARKGKIALVVSNVRFSGVNIPVDTLLAKIGLKIGLKSASIWTARKRGNSAQQMRDYSRKTSRESIVVWEN
jgi:DNA methylase